MRKFSSYGPPNNKLHYYTPRNTLIDNIITRLKGEAPDEGGHYITVWAPRQTGKTWVMREVCLKLKTDSRFEVMILSLQYLAYVVDVNEIVQSIAEELVKKLNPGIHPVNRLQDFHQLFTRDTLPKPLILILDEFDTLPEAAISGLTAIFRHIYNNRCNQVDQPTAAKDYLLHGLALIGVRSVLGIENSQGSPFNVQRSVQIPNLTQNEVSYLFRCYQDETKQLIASNVVERIFYEFQGQPGLTCRFGELLTETYNNTPDRPITMELFEGVYAAGSNLLPDNNILNLISKARQEPYKTFVLKLFRSDKKLEFFYRDPIINFLYMNGIVGIEVETLAKNYVKFTCPYIQKQLFTYFARELYPEPEHLYDPFEDISDTVTDDNLNLRRLLQRYEQYLQTNRARVLKNAPRRQEDLRVYEAVFHFHLYLYLTGFLRSYDAQVQPEFPTGNGQIDLLVRHAGRLFGLELKSFLDPRSYRKGLVQAAKYGQQLGVKEIWLALFIETVDAANRQRFEADYTDTVTGVTVHPVFVQTGGDS